MPGKDGLCHVCSRDETRPSQCAYCTSPRQKASPRQPHRQFRYLKISLKLVRFFQISRTFAAELETLCV